MCKCGESRQDQFRKGHGLICRLCWNRMQNDSERKIFEKVRQIRDLERAHWGVAR